MKLLILTSRFPYPLEKGDKLRAYHQIVALAKHHSLILVSLSDQAVSSEALAQLKPHCDNIYLFRLGKLAIGWHLLRALFSSRPFQVAYFYRKSIHAKLHKILEKEAPDLAYCQLIRMADYCKDFPIPVSLDYMDAFSLGLQRRYQKETGLKKQVVGWEAERVASYEKRIQKHFVSQCIISEADKQHLALPKPDLVEVIPNGIDAHYFQQDVSQAPVYDCVFVGNLGYFPNREACIYLAKEVMPLLSENLRLLLAGANADRQVKALGGASQTSVWGWVEDIRTAYGSGKIFVAPLFSGSGQQNKILEAMAMELPVITTPLVNKAIGAEPGKEILLAGSPAEFAQHITRLLENEEEAKEMGKAARQFVERNYAWEKVGRALNELLSSVF